MIKHTAPIAFFTVLVLGLQTSVAYGHSSETTDPAGDLSVAAPAYFDIVSAKVTEQVGQQTLYMKIEMASAIPKTPTTPTGAPQFFAANWIVDAPVGSPRFEYNVIVRYCSHTIQAPCLGDAWHWESALATPTGQTVGVFPFNVEGANVKAYVGLSQLGATNLTRLDWVALSRNRPGVSGAPPIDFAPNFQAVVSLFR